MGLVEVCSTTFVNAAGHVRSTSVQGLFREDGSYERLLPRKLTCPLKINGWKMYFLLK